MQAKFCALFRHLSHYGILDIATCLGVETPWLTAVAFLLARIAGQFTVKLLIACNRYIIYNNTQTHVPTGGGSNTLSMLQ